MKRPSRGQHPNELVLALWQRQLLETLRQTPWLANAMLQHGKYTLRRVIYFCERLQAQPRRVRRCVQAKLRTSLVGVCFLLALGGTPAYADTINVDGTTCTLVDAITAANADAATGGCTQGNGADSLVLQAGSTHTLTAINNTYYENNGLPVISSEVTIQGNGATIERGTGVLDQFLIFHVAPSGDLELNDTTVTGGIPAAVYNRGGAVVMNNVTISSNQTGIKNGYSGGMVEINNSTISGNADTGLFGESGSTNIVNMSMISGNVGVGCDGYEATLTIDGSTITGNNGGVGMLDGTVTIQNSTISGNTNSGVSATGTAVTISRSTIAENTASGPGGGVYFNAPYGGGSPLTISNSTMSGNTATLGGGVFNHGGALTLTNSTITGNTASSEGGGVYEYYGSVTLNRALISGNVAPIGRESYTYSGFVADHFNLIGYDGDAGVSGYGFTPGPSDIVPSVGIQVSDILDPVLQSNGGNTDTHALVLGSPAIDAAPAADCLAAPISGLDQRGVIRPQGSDCDIGAFELGDEAEIAVSLVVDQDSIDNGSPPNYFSIGDVNDDRAKLGQRRQLRFFEQNVGESIVLHTGEVGDEGWFALTQVPDTWNNAGPTDDGLQNYVGVTQPNGKIKVGKGLGRGNDPEKHLDEVPGVTPLRATGLAQLEGRRVCAVVQDSDVSINYDPLSGSLKGDSLGRVAFEVLLVTELTGYSASSLPKVDIEILDADEVCEGDLELYLDAPQPDSSSEPFDTVPPTES